ncbi:MAG TPA: tRNA (N6-isopentenyl adenosine(37)-C2)-methylthiotransferase MiaB [Candidatus Ruthenibacterium merdavium]|uniref:tRNA-2-methylthio-N(6)-dimethylallyladenosine synthase n=1 Tax=Candidatus Ruthenibacterium merdavium TaxID=2838752 RepID=A0A9D2TLE3_9FIRM|nr:tRNA (N6-isopentenyl adenosine(37)-C2)-methylthiotransferase MiaB [Candidatus Ruthenibacterium merdavium]
MQTIHFVKNEAAVNVILDYYQDAPPTAFVHSFGCQQNVNDGEKILGVLVNAGYGRAAAPEDADLIIFNTCAVREHAEQRVFGNVGALKKLKEQNPKLMIAVCGCMAQQKQIVEKFKASYPFVDIVFGVNAIDTLPQLIAQRITGHKRVMQMPVERTEIVEEMPIQRGSSFRAWLPIMYGCDNFCTYCIVPYVRGRERSRKSADILAEFRQLLAEGYRDITLLGQNVNSYGKGLEEGLDFADLLAMLDKEPGDYRIRFMTSHPKDATKKLIDTIAGGTHISHHLHLPVQSGSNEILEKMNRRYTVESYLALMDYAKERVPDMTYSSDIIVGFPGETEEDFEKTMELIRRVEYMQLFTFIYSKRSGTKAAEMPDGTPHEEKAARIGKIVALQDEIVARLTGALVGSVQRVLVEGAGRTPGVLTGRLDNNMIVEFSEEAPLGQLADVRITGAKGAVLKGELVERA